MEKQISVNHVEIIARLVKIQEDIDYIKERLSLEEEIEVLESASANDSTNFFSEHNL